MNFSSVYALQFSIANLGVTKGFNVLFIMYFLKGKVI